MCTSDEGCRAGGEGETCEQPRLMKSASLTLLQDNMPDEQRSSQGTGTGRQGETGSEERREEIADVGASESDEDGGGHLSQFSSLDEEVEPAKEKRKPQRSRVSKGARIKKEGASKESRDSTAAKLKKLKGLVLLCGTRKPWKKLFEEAGCADDEGADEETTKMARKRQVRLIEGVLQEIGMVSDTGVEGMGQGRGGC